MTELAVALLLWATALFNGPAAIALVFDAPATPLRIAACETRGYEYRNDLVGAMGELSMFQLHPIHGYNAELLRRYPLYAAMAAREIAGRWGWEAWSCY